MTIQCTTCAGIGHYPQNEIWLGFKVTCQTCWGSGLEGYEPNCDHLDAMWDGYGDVDDPQWDGANQCGNCGALFTDWPRVTS